VHRVVVGSDDLGDADFRSYFVVQTEEMLDRYRTSSPNYSGPWSLSGSTVAHNVNHRRRLSVSPGRVTLKRSGPTRPRQRRARAPSEVSAMTHGDTLTMTVDATQASLERRLREALHRHADPRRPRDHYAAIDTFLAATSRHLAAVEAVLVAEVGRTVPDGERLAHEYLHTARQLELRLAWVKAKLYGEAHAIHLKWPELWTEARTLLEEHNRLEREMVGELVRHGDPLTVVHSAGHAAGRRE
jgi:hypothetical protein